MVFVASIYFNFLMWEAWVKLLAQSFRQAVQQKENTHRFPTTCFVAKQKK